MASSSEAITKMAEQEQTLREVLENIAKENGYDKYQINIKPTTSEGANYSSVLFEATISEDGKDTLNLFAKVANVGEKIRANSPYRVFDTEIYSYTSLLAKFKEIETKHGVPEEERLITPKFYGYSDTYLKETIVMEDLTKKGFEMFDRFKTFDWNYAKESIRQLAKLHALSFAYSIQNPEEFEEKTKELRMQNNLDSMKGFVEKTMVEVMPSIKKEYLERTQRFFNDHMAPETFQELTKPQRRLVLAHGDYRPSNIMHKLNEDGTYQIIPIDYQTLNRSNPIVDILYFIINGSDQEFRKKYFKKTFDEYYRELRASLRRFGLDPDEVYSREDFDYDYKKVLPYGLLISFMLLLLVTVEVEHVPQITEESDMTDFVFKSNDRYRKRINEVIEDYIEFGIL